MCGWKGSSSLQRLAAWQRQQRWKRGAWSSPPKREGGKPLLCLPCTALEREMGKGSTRGKRPFPSQFLGGWGLSKPREKRAENIYLFNNCFLLKKKTKEEDNDFPAHSPACSWLPGGQGLRVSNAVPGWARVVLRACFPREKSRRFPRQEVSATPGAPSQRVLPPGPPPARKAAAFPCSSLAGPRELSRELSLSEL